jgi:hypothetical protein
LKKKFAIIIFIALVTNGYSQRKVLNTPTYDLDPLHFGFSVGFNTMDFNIYNSKLMYQLDTVYAVNAIRQAGFNIGIVSNLRLAKYFDLRFIPGISFGQRNMDYLIWKENRFQKKLMKIESTFLEFPLTLKYKAKRINNYRPYLVGGFNYRLDLAAQKAIKEAEKPKIRLEKNDLYYELGFGIDYYLPFFKFSTEIKYCVGLNNVIVPDRSQYTLCIEKLVSNIIEVSFYFE